MNINLEASEQHAIQAYENNKIQINSIIYESSLIVSREEIIIDVAINSIKEINSPYLELLTKSNPEIIIIGHEDTGVFPPLSIISDLSKMGIGIEAMSIGAACRTYNVLLSELRRVVAGFIFK
ncbi:hypothetical protein Lmor_0276 [Legionella moravica]|uniref:Protein of uncharacterized function (DUF498/DUF598) n=1 Tax=Legionella moravica TaxID=39962 RepID=A0A378JXT7_9GAMM|nr:MTH938/NDUFAF3 family protein [Legionella moravica]KTD38455.1 hypothetical protein Lmor_0276 [Legionella moravica]STX62850.1 Protein of uncharacterised function (DUF498/DUF598) [Legionella moravica]